MKAPILDDGRTGIRGAALHVHALLTVPINESVIPLTFILEQELLVVPTVANILNDGCSRLRGPIRHAQALPAAPDLDRHDRAWRWGGPGGRSHITMGWRR